MAAAAATAYDPAQDAARSESSDVELDAESQQELPSAEDLPSSLGPALRGGVRERDAVGGRRRVLKKRKTPGSGFEPFF